MRSSCASCLVYPACSGGDGSQPSVLSREVSLPEAPRLGNCHVCAGNSLEDTEHLEGKLSCPKADIFDRATGENGNMPTDL